MHVSARYHVRVKNTDPKKHCAWCNKLLERKRYPGGRLEDFAVFLTRKYCNRQCMSKFFKGAELQDKANRNRCYQESQRLKRNVHACEKCGSTEDLEVHHIDRDWSNNRLSNLIKLCRKCHKRAHKTRHMHVSS